MPPGGVRGVPRAPEGCLGGSLGRPVPTMGFRGGPRGARCPLEVFGGVRGVPAAPPAGARRCAAVGGAGPGGRDQA